MLKHLLGAAIIAAVFSTSSSAEVLWSVEKLEQPESAVFDPNTQNIVISNISGSPMEPNGKGYLSLVDDSGNVIDAKWVQDLDAPKGMAIMDGRLFVADLTKLRIIDLTTGDILENIEAEGAVFLNDITASKDRVWVSDMMTHTVWQYYNGVFTKFLEDEALEHPNGLLFDEDRLIVGSWGTDIQADFTTKTLGSLLSINLESKAITPIKGAENLGNLDGVIRVGEYLLVNDWIAGKVFTYRNGESQLVGEYPSGLADIASVGTMVLMPYMMDAKLEAFDANSWLK